MVIDRDDVNKVYYLMFKIMEDIFMGMIKCFMGLEELVVIVVILDNGGKVNLFNMKGIGE